MNHRIAVIIPCYNEAGAIAGVVSDFRKALPESVIYVYDNNSSDDTCFAAEQAGAVVRHELRQGKGYVISRAFADIDADIYLMVDGDGTYDASAAPAMVRFLVENKLDMVVGTRQANRSGKVYPKGHRFGNRMLTSTINVLFRNHLSDVLSGYRAFSRRFIKSFPTLAQGFEIEVKLTIYALEMQLGCAEVPTRYGERAEGTVSKLNTYRDGCRILYTILSLFKEIRPFVFFGIISAILGFTSIGLAIPILNEYLATGLVPRFPTAILSTGIMLAAAISLNCGIILETVTAKAREQKRLVYLGHPWKD
ncbi:MAG: glycosyltransferase [Syntrophales bacterium]|jgi:glycosyltransferase involved in cell wall biosynthesis|nr:glycosyltransferase [Syntrophales bacterium]